MSQASQGDIDQQALYGRHDRVADERADIETSWLKRRYRWAEKVMHRALNQPMDADDDMDVRVNNGMGWKELAVIGSLALGGGALGTHTVREILSDRKETSREVIRELPSEPHQHTDRDTLVVPRLRFGPDQGGRQ